MSNNAIEPNTMQLPNDIDLMKYMLENAEIVFDELTNGSEDSADLITDIGFIIKFGPDGKLLGFEQE